MVYLKAAIYEGPRKLAFKEVPTPNIGEGEALVRTRAVGICTTDIHIYEGKLPIAKPPLIMGHEASGDVVEIKGESKISVGARVVIEPCLHCGRCEACLSGTYNVCFHRKHLGIDVDGCFAEYVRIPIENLHIVPEDLSYEEAALTEPACVAIHAVRRARVSPGEFVAIIGAGAIGLFAMQAAKSSGADVIISDILNERLEIAKKLGADVTVNPIEEDIKLRVMEETGGLGAHVVIEAVGTPQTIYQTTSLARTGGRIVIIGLSGEKTEMDIMDIVRRELEVIGSDSCLMKLEVPMKLISDGKIKARPLISHILSLDKLEDALDIAKERKGLKVIVKP